jgi:hypothetical protein
MSAKQLYNGQALLMSKLYSGVILKKENVESFTNYGFKLKVMAA